VPSCNRALADALHQSNTQEEARTMNRLVQPVRRFDHVLGPPGAAVILLEYGDYECPHCQRAHAVLAEVLSRVIDEVLFVYRHFPLTQIHPHATLAAQAAEAAGAQDRFWEMHHMLFEHQNALEPDDLVNYAKAIGLDFVRFAQDVRLQVYLPEVRADFLSGVRSGVNGTPTFFINGERLNTPWDDPLRLLAALAEAA
jgi:protein-disulfide isomerase